MDVAEYLTEKGFDAASLKGGYISWLLDAMKEDEVAERDIKADVEQSIRKKFKKSIWRKFTKAINTYELVKPGDPCSWQSCFRSLSITTSLILM